MRSRASEGSFLPVESDGRSSFVVEKGTRGGSVQKPRLGPVGDCPGARELGRRPLLFDDLEPPVVEGNARSLGDAHEPLSPASPE